MPGPEDTVSALLLSLPLSLPPSLLSEPISLDFLEGEGRMMLAITIMEVLRKKLSSFTRFL